MTGAGPGTQSRSPPWVVKIPVTRATITASRICTDRKLESGTEPGLEPRHADMQHRQLNSCFSVRLNADSIFRYTMENGQIFVVVVVTNRLGLLRAIKENNR